MSHSCSQICVVVAFIRLVDLLLSLFFGKNPSESVLVAFHLCVLKTVYSSGILIFLSLCYCTCILLSMFFLWLFDLPLGMEIPDGDLMAPDFLLPRQGPVVNLNPVYMQQQEALFARMVVAVIIDRKNIPAHRLQHIINTNWLLLGEVTIRSKHRNFFILEFSEVEDMEFMLANGPWTVQNCLMILEKWCPNMTVNNLRVKGIDLWFKFSGIPFDFVCPEVAWKLGTHFT